MSTLSDFLDGLYTYKKGDYSYWIRQLKKLDKEELAEIIVKKDVYFSRIMHLAYICLEEGRPNDLKTHIINIAANEEIDIYKKPPEVTNGGVDGLIAKQAAFGWIG